MTVMHWSSLATPSSASSSVHMRSAATTHVCVRRLARQAVVQSRGHTRSGTVCAFAAPTHRTRHSGRREEYSEQKRVHSRGVSVPRKCITSETRRTQHTPLRAISDSQDSGSGEWQPSSDATGARVLADAKKTKDDQNNKSRLIATAFPLVAVLLLVAIGAYYKDDIFSFLSWFTGYVEDLGPAGPALFMMLYVLLEILAVPAIPLTMSAGAIFGPVQGTAMVSVSATLAATASFLIARYALRSKVKDLAQKYPKFAAIDNAIGEDSFRVVALLRLSPLLPFALSNYLYGLTSVKTKPYVLASWLGMLPGTFAYVSAGSVGRTMMEAGGGAGEMGWTHVAQIGGGFLLALISGSYVAKVASEALKDVEEEMNAIEAEAIDEASTKGV